MPRLDSFRDTSHFSEVSAATRLTALTLVAVLAAVVLLAQSPNDPLYSEEWHLKNTGQSGGTPGEDANVEPVWSTFRGSANEAIAVVDDGLQIGHEDLAPNVIAGLSFNYLTGTNDPTPASGVNGHGTAVAGVAAARGFNGIGVTGVAPLGALAGFNYLASATAANEVDALSRSSQTIDIYNNSWGPFDGGTNLAAMPALTESALAGRVASGRGGLGNIYVWASGNGGLNDNSNYDGYANSRYAIAVSASTNVGARASYSEEGANILVNASSSGGSLGIMTTDLSGPGGYNPGTAGAGGSPNPSLSTNYTAVFGGTSSAAPLVSGVIALMLQTNPNLGWRDVRSILATTAAKNSPNDSDWANNGAGLHVNHKFGFGRVNAQAAVTAACGWPNAGVEMTAQGLAIPNLPIPDCPADCLNNGTLGAPVSSTIAISNNFKVEFAEVFFSATDHTYWGDLQIELTSPAGSRSVLSKPHSAGAATGPLTTRYNNWRFGTVRHFGESSAGTWTLTVRDGGPLDTGTLQSWTLKLYGSAIAPPAFSVTTSISGSGAVTSTPPGNSCGSTHVATYAPGQMVTLRPIPVTGVGFAGWGGDADCLDGQVTLTRPVACTASFQTLTTQLKPHRVDLSGDGSGDVFLYNETTGLWSMAFSNGAGGFNFVNAAWSAHWTVVPAYLNGDTLVDFFLYDSVGGQWFQALNDGVGGFIYTTGFFSPGWQVYAGRFNADGIEDIFLYNPTTGFAFQCWIDGNGGFIAFFREAWSSGWSVFPTALDGDALTDVFLYNVVTGQWVRANNTGVGTFTFGGETWSAGWSVTIADLNGDGLDDVFLYYPTTGQWYQCLNNGESFTLFSEMWAPGWQVFRGRLNSDVRDDLLLYNPMSGAWTQAFSDGTGSFSRYVAGTWSPNWRVALTDLNGDDFDDVFLYNSTNGQYYQVLTNPLGIFSNYFTAFFSPGFTVAAQR